MAKQKLWRNREEMLRDFLLFDQEELEAAMEWHAKLDKPLLTLEDIELIKSIVESRTAIKTKLKAALVAGDEREALRLARKLVGLEGTE